MYSEAQARLLVEQVHPGVKAVDSFPYKNLYLVRVEHGDAEEANYDPFFSVNPENGDVKEFSVITDGDPVEIAKAFEQGR